jgi:hypothetical protein
MAPSASNGGSYVEIPHSRAGAAIAFATPALADWYIVHAPDRHCRVVERYVPAGDHDMVRVGPLRFGTRDEAEHEIRTVCRDNGYYREERSEHRREGDIPVDAVQQQPETAPIALAIASRRPRTPGRASALGS